MALVQCPDCGKMVSSRVEACPNCGCPAEFFINDSETNSSADDAQEKDVATSNYGDTAAVDSDNSTTDEKIEFVFGNYVITYPKNTEKYAALFGAYLHAADASYAEMCKLYDSSSSIGKALEILPDKANELILGVINEGVRYFYSIGVNITAEQFISKYRRKYTMEYSRYYDVTVEEYAEILGEKEQLASYREAVKNSRGQWVGGGFGVKGAIKGAATAKALNLGSDFLHSFGDSARERQDNQKIQSKLKKLYKNSRGQLCHSVRTCILNVYKAIVEELDQYNYFPATISLSEEDAETLFKNTKDFESDPETIKKNMLQCILYYPGNKRYYMELSDMFFNEDTQLNEFLSFWNLEYLLSDLTEQKEGSDSFDQYLIEKGIESFNFDDFSAENTALLWKSLNDFTDDFPEVKGLLGSKVTEFLKNAPSPRAECNKDILVDYSAPEINEREFFQVVYNNNKYDYRYRLPDFWCFYNWKGGISPSSKIRELYEVDGDKIQLYCDISLMENGSKGIAITKKFVIDLKSKIKLDITKINNIRVEQIGEYKLALCIGDGTQTIQFCNDIEDDVIMWYIGNVIKIYAIRFCGNMILQRDADYTNAKVRRAAIQEKERKEQEALQEQNERSEINKNIYIDLVRKNIKNHPEYYNFEFSNLFRKRIKYFSSSEKSQVPKKYCINKYDFELEDGSLKSFFAKRGMSGEYIIEAEDDLILTDRNIYLFEKDLFAFGKTQDEPYERKLKIYPLNTINEIITEMTLEDNRDHFRIITYKGTEEEIESSWAMGHIVNEVNAAIDPFRGKNYIPKYKTEMRYCRRCGSQNVVWKMGEYRCLDCPKRQNLNIAYRKKRDVFVEEKKLLDNLILNEDKTVQILWFDEHKQIEWLLEAGIMSQPEKSSIENEKLMADNLEETTNATIVPAENNQNDMMFCTSCGKKIKRTSKFCNFCGQPVTYNVNKS